MTSKQPQIGDRYRDIATTSPKVVWILSELFTSRNGIEHAHLVSAADATESKTLALSVVADPKRFVRAEALSVT
jgi:hypothetical protein